jgi:hypothetical protein
MERVNEGLEHSIDFDLKDQFPRALVVKREKLPGMTTPVISWSIAIEPMMNIEISLSKYKNHLKIVKYICEDGSAVVHTIYNGPVPIKTIGPNDHVFDENFIMKLVAHYKFVAL